MYLIIVDPLNNIELGLLVLRSISSVENTKSVWCENFVKNVQAINVSILTDERINQILKCARKQVEKSYQYDYSRMYFSNEFPFNKILITLDNIERGNYDFSKDNSEDKDRIPYMYCISPLDDFVFPDLQFLFSFPLSKSGEVDFNSRTVYLRIKEISLNFNSIPTECSVENLKALDKINSVFLANQSKEFLIKHENSLNLLYNMCCLYGLEKMESTKEYINLSSSSPNEFIELGVPNTIFNFIIDVNNLKTASLLGFNFSTEESTEVTEFPIQQQQQNFIISNSYRSQTYNTNDVYSDLYTKINTQIKKDDNVLAELKFLLSNFSNISTINLSNSLDIKLNIEMFFTIFSCLMDLVISPLNENKEKGGCLEIKNLNANNSVRKINLIMQKICYFADVLSNENEISRATSLIQHKFNDFARNFFENKNENHLYNTVVLKLDLSYSDFKNLVEDYNTYIIQDIILGNNDKKPIIIEVLRLSHCLNFKGVFKTLEILSDVVSIGVIIVSLHETFIFSENSKTINNEPENIIKVNYIGNKNTLNTFSNQINECSDIIDITAATQQTNSNLVNINESINLAQNNDKQIINKLQEDICSIFEYIIKSKNNEKKLFNHILIDDYQSFIMIRSYYYSTLSNNEGNLTQINNYDFDIAMDKEDTKSKVTFDEMLENSFNCYGIKLTYISPEDSINTFLVSYE